MNQPLKDKRIVVTRASIQAEPMCDLVRELGGQPVELPLIEFKPLVDRQQAETFVADLGSYDWLIFTSANAIRFFFQIVDVEEIEPLDLSLACVGQKTAKLLEQYLRWPDFVPDQFTSEFLADQIDIQQRQKVLLPGPLVTNPGLSEKLVAKGAEVVPWPIYETVQLEFEPDITTRLQSGTDAITFASPSAVDSFCDRIPDAENILCQNIIACIGPMTQRRAIERGIRVDIMPETYDVPNLVQALANHFQDEARQS